MLVAKTVWIIASSMVVAVPVLATEVAWVLMAESIIAVPLRSIVPERRVEVFANCWRGARRRKMPGSL